MEIKEFVCKAHENARTHGFWEETEILVRILELEEEEYKVHHGKATVYLNNAISTNLMLIVSELGEAVEALRKKDTENFKEELADVAIRLADLCGGLGIDLEAEILKKMEKNKNRPYKHGKEF